jgi:hypothetical protein
MVDTQSKADASTSNPPRAEKLRIPGNKRCRLHDTAAGYPDGVPSGGVSVRVEGVTIWVPGVGRHARVEDTEGNVIGVIKPTMP